MDRSLKRKNLLSPIAKGVMVGVAISVVGVLVLALIYKVADLSNGVTKGINQIIKISSIFFACKISLKSDKNKGLFKGMAVGALYTVLSYTIFSALSSTFSFGLNFIIDIIFGTILGGICGFLCDKMQK